MLRKTFITYEGVQLNPKHYEYLFYIMFNLFFYIQQNLNFGLNSSLSSITFSFVGELTELISSSGEGFELIEIRISIGTDFRIDA